MLLGGSVLGGLPRGFPLGLGGLYEEPDERLCPVCGEVARFVEKRRDGKRVYIHHGLDFCVSKD